MSLISVRNFVAPLTNRINLITILVLAFAFGAFRLAGGAIDFGSSDYTPDTRSSGSMQPSGALVPSSSGATDAEPNSAQRAAKPAGQVEGKSQEDLLGEMLGFSNPKFDSGPPGSQNNAPAEKGRGSLDDIERKLGLK